MITNHLCKKHQSELPSKVCGGSMCHLCPEGWESWLNIAKHVADCQEVLERRLGARKSWKEAEIHYNSFGGLLTFNVNNMQVNNLIQSRVKRDCIHSIDENHVIGTVKQMNKIYSVFLIGVNEKFNSVLLDYMKNSILFSWGK